MLISRLEILVHLQNESQLVWGIDVRRSCFNLVSKIIFRKQLMQTQRRQKNEKNVENSKIHTWWLTQKKTKNHYRMTSKFTQNRSETLLLFWVRGLSPIVHFLISHTFPIILTLLRPLGLLQWWNEMRLKQFLPK